MTRRLVLASTSRYRRMLMDRLGIAYEAVSPDFDEIRDEKLDPHEQVAVFARGKARAVRDIPDALIIGSDQALISHDGRFLGKAKTQDRAVAQLATLRGGTHELVTAVAVYDTASGVLHEGVNIHRLTFRADLEESDLRTYVEADDPVGCAGSFKIESLGIVLFEKVEGTDPTGIIGLPLTLLRELLAAHGVRLLALRARA